MDVNHKWNVTYSMLNVSFEYRLIIDKYIVQCNIISSYGSSSSIIDKIDDLGSNIIKYLKEMLKM